MANFYVEGPFAIFTNKGQVSKFLNSDSARKFWEDKAELAKSCGCYVFGFRASKGYKPFYVGKATKNFKQEVFAPHKLNKIYEALAQQKKGTLVLFFVRYQKSKGKINRLAIGEVETFLIQSGLEANPNLLNDRSTSVEKWAIKGIIRSGRGQPSSPAQDLKQCLKLN